MDARTARGALAGPRRSPGEGEATARVATWKRGGGPAPLAPTADDVAREEPLEIRLTAGGDRQTVAVTMRTPGCDAELAAGFLYAEGLVRDRALITGLEVFREEDPDTGTTRDAVEVALAARRLPNLRSLERHFFTGSACGVCGRAALDELLVEGCERVADGPVLAAATVHALPPALRAVQRDFDATGGVHAAALFDADGRLDLVREDVGRHNALDKLVGRALLDGRLGPDRRLDGRVVLVSGRASFEIVQKSVAAGIPVVCAVSAPTSLAVEVAERFGITLVAFLREGRFNVYSHPQRIAGS